MLKKFSKTMLAFLLCLGLLTASLSPVFADTIEGINTNVESMAAASNYQLVDGGSCTQTIQGQNIGIFTLNVSDRDLRQIVVSSSAKVKTYILPADSGLGNFIRFDSGQYRLFNMIAWHFMPGIQYNVLVIPETTADVTVSMSKTTSSFSWINVVNALNEQNILMSGESESYGMAIQGSGIYRMTISTVSKLDAYFANGSSTTRYIVDSRTPCTIDFFVDKPTEDLQSKFVLSLYNTDSPNQGGAYTVTIQKLY